jgi:hypothetical protein
MADQRALFTGSRGFSDEAMVRRVIKDLGLSAVVIHGGARGLDALADRFARERGLAVEPYPADWDGDGDAAGPIRNQRMLEQARPTEAHAFPLPGSSGTWDMVRRLRAARIPVTIHGTGDTSMRDALLAAAGDLSDLYAYDSETFKFRGGLMAPQLVCSSTAWVSDGKIVGELHDSPIESVRAFLRIQHARLALTRGSYDLAVLAQHDPELIEAIFRAMREGRVHDILIGQSLNDIYWGHLGKNPDGSDLRHPVTGEVMNRYSLELVNFLMFGRVDAKKNDEFRQSYALFSGIPKRRWPPAARQYPVDDVINTIEPAIAQQYGWPGKHQWETLPRLPGDTDLLDSTACKWCGVALESDQPIPEHCPSAPWREPYRNAQNHIQQIEFDFAQSLGAAHSFRTDPEKVAKLIADAEAKSAVATARFQKFGWIREDGTEDQAAVKRSIALAYGASGTCKRCGGGAACPKCEFGKLPSGYDCRECGGLGVLVGRIQSWKEIDCRGEKIRGRYRGCEGDDCKVCHGARKHEVAWSIVVCKHVYDADDKTIERGCDGTGLDLTTAPLMPRTKNKEHPRREGGVSTERDTKMSSGDDDLSDYGEDEYNKTLSTYAPYLLTGTKGPLFIRSNPLVDTGRCSYEDCPIHQFPRQGGERNCIRARGAWCGYPHEMVFGSTDYSAGELCTLAQYNFWLFKYSRMMEAINSSGDPGILHSELAAEVLGIPLEEFLKRLKAKDKQAVEFRQASKPKNFGAPAGMGSPKIVATNRKKNAGFTVCEGGPHRNPKGQEGYWGIRFCILIGGKKRCGTEKITSWGKSRTPCAPVCKACVEVEHNILSPAYFRRFPEMKDYHKWVTRMTDANRRAPCLVWDADKGRPKIIRERGGCEFSAFANNGFQAMLADIGKDAFVTATRECYLGVTDDGSPSPLAGCRLPAFIHDEPISELFLDTAHLSGPRIAEIMVASGKKLAPDVFWKAETALAFFLDKGMEPVYDPFGKLVPWGPIPDYLKERLAA